MDGLDMDSIDPASDISESMRLRNDKLYANFSSDYINHVDSDKVNDEDDDDDDDFKYNTDTTDDPKLTELRNLKLDLGYTGLYV